MIYLDHAAGTPVLPEVWKAMEPYAVAEFFNPSAAYLPAKKVASDYEAAKGVIAHAIGAKGGDLVMTAGATEANNLAFSAIRSKQVSPLSDNSSQTALAKSSRSGVVANSACPQVLYLTTEHDSVRRKAQQFPSEPIRVDKTGRIDLEDFKGKLSDTVEFVSVALVNNELGTIQPLSEVAEIIREAKFDRLRRGVKTPLYLHSDASQALNLLEVSVARLGVDLLTLNAAKVYGPKGAGALYVSHEVRLSPVSYGGGQERGLRAGTENVSGVIGFAKAVEIAKKHLNGNRKKYAEWKKIFLAGLQGAEVVNRGKTLDNFIVLCYNGVEAERLVFLLEDRGVYVATGAACAASKGRKSHVLAAIGLSDSEINGSLRITFGETNDEEQIREAVKIINEVVTAERKRVNG